MVTPCGINVLCCPLLHVPGGPSVACSTATAVLWDAAWAGKEDPSGRAVAVHDDAYDKKAAH